MARPPKKSDALTAKQRAEITAFVSDVVRRWKSASTTNDSAERGRRIDVLEKYVNQQIQINLTAWQEQADSAITDAAYPVAEESRFFFYVALAGNLLWAATCFINPAVAGAGLAIKLMSVGGAAIGSGVVQQIIPEDAKPEDGKRLVRQYIAKKRGELEDLFKQNRRVWASTLDGIAGWSAAGDHPEKLIDEFDVYIWTQMFPQMSYTTDRFDNIRLQFLNTVESSLADFNRQWQKFRQDTAYFGGGEIKRRGIVFRPIVKIMWNGKQLTAEDREFGTFHEPGKFY
jgi:hypothetical protein